MILLTLLEHPYTFFSLFFVVTLALGAWLGHIFSRWRIKKLKARLELLKVFR